MQPINIFNSQDVKVTIDENGTPVDVYISGGTATELQFYSTFSDLPSPGQGGILYVTEDTNYLYRWDGAYVQVGGGSLTWGQITGTLSDQTDLQDALDDKVPYTGATGNIDIGNNSIIANDGTYDSEMSGAYFGVENNAGTEFGLLEYNRLSIVDNDTLSTMQVTSAGLTFPDSTTQTTAAVAQSLQDVTDVGNTTTNDIQLINDADVILGAGGKVLMDNGSKLQEGTTDAGNGGAKGIALKCSADYELKWEAGRLYTMEQNGFTIREVSHNFTFIPSVTDDDAKGFVIGSRWILDNGDIYTCTDATTGAAVWSLESLPSGTVTSVDTAGLISGGPITTSGTITTSMANNKLVGRYSSGSGIMEEITIGDGLTLTGVGILNNTATPTELGYYGGWQDNITQTATASNTGYAMIFRVVDLENQVRVVTNGTNLTRITFDNTGIYNLQFSSQFQNTSNQLADVTIWLRLNGTDVAGSAGFISIPNSHGGTPGHSIASWNYLLSVIAGEYYEIVWSTTNHTNVTMEFYSAGSPPPSCASVIATVTQQSGIMAGTGITALNSLTGSVQTLVSGTSGSDFGISSSGTIHTFNLPTASATKRGALSSADFTTFNNKQNALTNPVTGTGTNNEIAYFNATGSTIGSLSTATYPSLTELSYVKGVTSAIQTQLNGKQATLTNPITGTGTSGQVAYWNGTSTQTGSNNLFWDATNNRLGIGTNSPSASFEVSGGNIQLSNATAIRFRYNTGTAFTVLQMFSDNNTYLDGASDINLRVNAGGTTALVAKSNGNILIGTTTDSGYKLDVNGTARVQGNLTLGTGPLVLSNENNTAGRLLISRGNTNDITLRIITQGSGEVQIFGTQYGNLSANESITFQRNGGGFSIGSQTVPTQLFELERVYSGATSETVSSLLLKSQITKSGGTSTINLINVQPIFNTTGGTQTIRGLYHNPTLTSTTGTTHRAIETVTGDVYFASTSGTVGIGTAPTSTYKLDVNGTARVQGTLEVTPTTGITLGGGANTLDYAGSDLNIGRSATWANIKIFGGGTNSISRITINSAGVIIGSGLSYVNFTTKVQYGGVDLITEPTSRVLAFGSVSAYFDNIDIYTRNSAATGVIPVMRLHNSGVVIRDNGSTSKNASAILEVQSTTRGFLPPVMTGSQGEAISSPAAGLMIYTTSAGSGAITSSGWWGYDGVTWNKLN